MKIIDIRARHIPDSELLKESHARFHLDIKEIPKEEVKKIPPYEIEIGKKESASAKSGWFKGWLKGIKEISFSFTTHFALKRYRIKASFIFACLTIFFLIGGLAAMARVGSLKGSLMESGKLALRNASPQNLFAASLAVKETSKSLAVLGEVPELFSQKFKALNLGSVWAEFFLRAWGYYNPRYYLVLFQNNSEIRPTGGFIGSYALLKLDEGKIEIKKIEGIFNVSGQQEINVVPPKPLQKVSTSWQLHDANWFFDFPASAKALTWLYEKSGGPTVDGVIAVTPELVQTLFSLTGPIDLPSFGLTLDEKNFMDMLQYEVEVKYKERGLSDPKEILAHLAPLLIEKLSSLPAETLFDTLFGSFEKKEILLYFSTPQEEAFVNYQNWGGAVKPAGADYLAVVNTNINGFKTDRVVTQKVFYETAMREDGSVIDTVTITRAHTGGNTPYDWYNRVNADYLRVYVPKGSQLLEVRGHTLEFTSPRIDYQKAGYKEYAPLKEAEEKTVIDEETGTRIGEENGKTVFGNWTYVSPGETVRVSYRYLLPFKLGRSGPYKSHTLTVQKQPGITYWLDTNLRTPPNWKLRWQSETESLIDRDRTYAWIFSL
ncbi:MAG: DUF4012 domain-containing protein [Candidatus Portnoybacteria bacterium]|nr:DUF4012 domain-containing protein [Candidatus Portnoybacteria bacterium]